MVIVSVVPGWHSYQILSVHKLKHNRLAKLALHWTLRKGHCSFCVFGLLQSTLIVRLEHALYPNMVMAFSEYSVQS